MNYREVTDEQLTFLKLKYNWNDAETRIALALEGIALNILIDDPDAKVRLSVGSQEYGLDRLEIDPDKFVRQGAKELRKRFMYRKAKELVDDMFNMGG